MIEFTLVGIPIVFVFISIFEMARGMWVYHTLAYAVKDAMRYAVVHGRDYDSASADSPKRNRVVDIADRIRWAGVGLDPRDLTVNLTTSDGSVTCGPMSSCLPSTDPASPGPGNVAQWPAYPGNIRGSTLEITASYRFPSALSMFWPGAGPGMVFGTIFFRANSRERVQF
jgi:Flp pilus assembly protein TadG